MTIAAQIRALKDMTVNQLREKYEEVWGETTNARNKDYLFRKIAWKIQELEYGGISERAKKRALEIANESDLRMRPPKGYQEQLEEMLSQSAEDNNNNGKQVGNGDIQLDPRLPMIGSQITKNYKGRTLTVTVLGSRQFEFEGTVYTSLSAIAKKVTGSAYNGFAFFGLSKKGDQ